ncbi:MAG TPA: hypothetical protein VHB21_25235, partial [Minicystis sp.]|nr:hypothetical protein [Minicystis sp.]
PLRAYPGMTVEERAVAVGPEGRTDRYASLRGELVPGDAVAFDDPAALPHLLVRDDLSTPLVVVSPAAPPAAALAGLARDRVRVAVLQDGSPLAAAASPIFTPRFRCRASPCTVYRVR